MTNWFEKLVKFNPNIALFIGRSLLVVIYSFCAPLEGVYQAIKEFVKSVKRISSAFAKPFKNFTEEWKAIKTEVEYLEGKNDGFF